jgi:tetratricopeptide (TPR) repeat protein
MPGLPIFPAVMDSLFARAYAAHRDGRLVEAERDYCATIDAEPAHADALHLLGVLRHQQGRHAEAAELVGRAIQVRPNDAGLQLNLGNALKALGQLDGAIERFRNALTLAPEFPLAHYNLGNAYAAAGRHADAVDAFRRSLRLLPNDASIWNNFGNSLHAIGRHQEAIDAFTRALRVRPRHAGAHNNLGMALAALGRAEEAIVHFRDALAAEPRFIAAHFNLGNALDAVGQHAQAVAAFEAALALHAPFPPALLGLGNALAATGRHAEAIGALERAVGLDPHLSLAWLSLGNAHHALGAHEAALRAYDQALRLRPDLASARLNRALTLLALGDFRRGLPGYEARLDFAQATRTPDEDRPAGSTGHEKPADAIDATAAVADIANPLPRWHGEPLADGTLCVISEQGFGDTLQFMRFVPLARERVGRLVFAVQGELLPLIAPLAQAWQVAVVERGSRIDADMHCPLLSLPLALGTTADELPAQKRYVDVPAAYRRQWRGSLGGHAKRKVGLAWSGRIQQHETRAMALSALGPLFALAGVDWIVLQPNLNDDDKRELDLLARSVSIHRFDAHIRDFADTAAIVDRLDAVVSIDTSVAHLAGALGKPLFLMLPFAADWRWFLEQDQSPWYPSARLIRQRAPGAWGEVVQAVVQLLEGELGVAPLAPPSGS